MVLHDSNGTRTPLGGKLGGGGEAEIFRVDGQPELAAKVYRTPTKYREDKLRAMIARPPKDPALHVGHTSICWPKSLLFNEDSACVGFSMPLVDLSTRAPALMLCSPQDRRQVFPGITWKHLVRAAAGIAGAVGAIHAQGHVIGDFNESNILVENNGLVTLLDCDSIQISDRVRAVCYRCLTGKPDFTPPELQGCDFSKVDRCSAHDNFGLGVVIFLLLMEGAHPFSGVWRKKGKPPALGERIRTGISPYAGHPDIEPIPGAPPLGLLPRKVSGLFLRCFKDGHADPSRRPNPSEWTAALSELEESLTQCAVRDRHVYGNHLAACPWCERAAVPGGVDPFPDQAQGVGRGPQQIAAAPGHSAPGTGELTRDESPSGTVVRRPLLKWVAALVAGAALVAALWAFARAPLGRIWSSAGNTLTSLLGSESHPTLSPPLLCTGVDSSGVPTGVAESFSEAQIRDTGLIVFMTYTGAVPQQSTFQMRLTINGNVLESKVNTFERNADFLQVKLGNDLPAGNHTIEFLVDGKPQQSASLVIYGDSTADAGSPAAARRPAKPSRRLPAPKPGTTAQPDEQPGSVPVVASSAPAQEAASPPQPGPSPAPSPPPSARYEAAHRHSIGSCAGELRLTPGGIEFVSDWHVFRLGIGEVQLDKDGILDPSGKAWHFAIPGMKVQQLLGRWKREELFARSSDARLPGPAAGPSKSAAAQTSEVSRRFDARHKHRLGSCSGDLELTPRSIEFTSGEHTFTFGTEEVQVEGDAVRDPSGKVWRIDVQGEDTAELLRSWKAGRLDWK